VVSNLTGFLTATSPPVDAVDQETAAAQQVADAHAGKRGSLILGFGYTFLWE
jgi:hypothetical protein